MNKVDSRTRVVLLLALTFLAGAAGGVAADRLSLLPGSARAEAAAAEEPADDREGDREEGRRRRETTIERFADELGLTAEQRRQIEGALEHYRTSMKTVWSDVRPRYRSLVDSVRQEIETFLTPEQVEEYRELLRSQRGGERDRGDSENEEER